MMKPKLIFVITSVCMLFVFCSNSQKPDIQGCTDSQACNYDNESTTDDGSCLYNDCFGVCGGDAVIDCTGICGGSFELDECGECLHPINQTDTWNSTCSGCMDESAANYDSDAIIDDGSCVEVFPDGWILSWNDEFNSDNINGANWTHEIWSPYHVNNELQAYTDRPDNSFIENGHLVIRALNENFNSAEYTSARLTSSGKGEWQYGRCDIRAKIPLGQGTWPAIWMLGSNIGSVGWPSCGEIDIMEHVNNNLIVHSSIHTNACFHALAGYPGACPDYNISCPGGCPDALPNTYWKDLPNVDDWHVYGMIWTADYLTFTIDNAPWMTVSRPIIPGDDMWPFDQEFFFILNLAIGGDWPGNPDDSIFPVSLEIDYVRVYVPE